MPRTDELPTGGDVSAGGYPPALRLLLASTDVGRHDVLASLVAAAGGAPVVAVCTNALDLDGPGAHTDAATIGSQLAGAGLRSVPLDLTAPGTGLRGRLGEVGAVWLSGGNTFWLAHLLERSGVGRLLTSLSCQGLVVAGESAGAAVLGASLDGVRAMDDPTVVVGDPAPLGLVDDVVWPHHGHPDHAAVAPEVARRWDGIGRLLRIADGDAVVVCGGRRTTVTL